MNGWRRMLWTVAAVAAWSALARLAVHDWDVFGMSRSDWADVVSAAVAGVGMLATNWLAPWVRQYGIGSED